MMKTRSRFAHILEKGADALFL